MAVKISRDVEIYKKDNINGFFMRYILTTECVCYLQICICDRSNAIMDDAQSTLVIASVRIKNI